LNVAVQKASPPVTQEIVTVKEDEAGAINGTVVGSYPKSFVGAGGSSRRMACTVFVGHNTEAGCTWS
jgi:hypothetical protein